MVTRSFQGTKRQAATALAKFVTEVEQGQVAKHHPETLADLLDQWLEAVAPKRSAHTMKEYRRMAATNIKPAIGTVPLPKLTGPRLRLLSFATPRREPSRPSATTPKAA